MAGDKRFEGVLISNPQTFEKGVVILQGGCDPTVWAAHRPLAVRRPKVAYAVAVSSVVRVSTIS